MKKFKEWIKLREDVGRARSKQADLQNVRIGKLGPYGTFGHTDVPDPISQGAAGLLSALGKDIGDKLGNIEPLPRIMNPFADFESRKQSADTLILQIPYIEKKQLPIRVNPNNPKSTFDNVYGYIKNNFELIRVNPEQTKVFDLFTYKDSQETFDDSNFALREIARAFTTALSKIRLRERFISKYPKIDEKFDFKNPQVFQKIIEIQDYQYLESIFQYKDIKSSMEDEENYRSAWRN